MKTKAFVILLAVLLLLGGSLGGAFAGGMALEYKRNGATSLYAALAARRGEVLGHCAPRHRHQEFLEFLRLLARTMLDKNFISSWTT